MSGGNKKLLCEASVIISRGMKLVKTVLQSLAAALQRLVAKSWVYGKHSKIRNIKMLSSHPKTQYL